MFNKKNFNLGVGISSSILSLAVSMIGYANFQLKHWWQLILCIPILFALFVLFVVAIELSLYCYERYLKKAHIRINLIDELNALEMLIDSLYEKELVFDNCKSDEYRAVLESEIQRLYRKACAKIDMLEVYSSSTILKEPVKLPNEALFEKYCHARDYIKTQHGFNDYD